MTFRFNPSTISRATPVEHPKGTRFNGAQRGKSVEGGNLVPSFCNGVRRRFVPLFKVLN